MRQYFIWVLSLSLLNISASGFAAEKKPAAAGKAAPAATQADGPISEEIKGEIKEQLDIQKPPPSIELTVKDIIDSGTERTDEVLQQARPIPSDQDYEHYAMLDSKQVMKPWNPLLPEPPLVTFYPGLSKVAAKRWEFRVSDQGGEIIKTVAGKGVPPRSVEWDGRNERGEYINVGTLYSYQFVTFDEHENAHTFPGEPFQVDALLYNQKGKITVEIANQRLFNKDSAEINPIMSGMFDRAIDVVRENSNKPLIVEVYSESVKSPLAEERRQKVVNMLSDATNIPAVDIKHKVDKIADRGDITRFVMNAK